MQNKTLQLKRALRTALLVLLLSVVGMGKGYAYCDFSETCSSGQLLFYKIIMGTSDVKVTYPGTISSPYGGGSHPYVQPTGNLVIPTRVIHEGTVYSVIGIDSYAFKSCTGLISVTIPQSVTSIGNDAFAGCTGLNWADYQGEISGWCRINFSNDKSNPCSYAKNTDNLKINGTQLTNLVIPSDITTIGKYTFYGCKCLSSITIHNSVRSIGDEAFRYCKNLTNVYWNAVNVTSYPTYNSSNNTLPFNDCTQLTTVVFGDLVQTIPDCAFRNCTGLSGNLIIPNSVTSIGASAFFNCSCLNSVTICNSVSSIKNDSFSGCTGLNLVNYTGEISEWCRISFSNNTSNPCYYAHNLKIYEIPLTNLVIPSGITTIGKYAFIGCECLTSVTIPHTVTSIDAEAFYYCTNLTTVNWDAISITSYLFPFNGCSHLTTVVFGNLVQTIPDGAFQNCTSLISVTIGNSVISIGNSAFQNCNNLNSVIIGDAVTSIGDSAFYGCSMIISITIPNSVTSIGNNAFNNCTKLSSVVIPNSITYIDDYTFSGCTGLISITMPNTISTIDKGAFSGCTGLTSIIFPNSVTSIGEDAFSGCTGLTSIIFPDSVISIGERAFSGCSGLESLVLNNVVIIGDYAFSSCNNLLSVTIPKMVSHLNNNAFSSCSRLTTVYFNAENAVGNSVFSNCPNLTTIHIGADVQEIGANIFKGCTGVHLIVALGPTPATLVGNAFADFADNSILMVSCGNKLNYFSVWNMFDFNNIMEDCGQYPISMNNIGVGGSVSASTTQAQMGQEVQLTVTPNAGMVLSSLTVCNASDPTQTFPVYPIGKGNKFGFIMPPYGVSVNATFVAGTSVEENDNVPVSVYPNPTKGNVTIEAEDLEHITISNLLGQTIYDGNASGNVYEYDFSKHKTGIYLIRIETASGVAVKKVSVTR